MQMKRRLYIAGPISGKEERNLPAFRAAQRFVVSRGYEALIPHEIRPWQHHKEPCPEGYDSFDGHSSACYLRADLRALLGCEGVFMLRGWQYSRGGSLEHRVAVECGLALYYQETGPPPPILRDGAEAFFSAERITKTPEANA